MRENNYQPKIEYSAKVYFKWKGKLESFFYKQKKNEGVETNNFLLKDILQSCTSQKKNVISDVIPGTRQYTLKGIKSQESGNNK